MRRAEDKLEPVAVRANAHAAEIGRFLVVGFGAVGLDFLVYFLLTSFVPLIPTFVAKATSFVAGAMLAFIANRDFVFRAGGKAREQIVPFVLLYALSLGINGAVNELFLSLGAVKVVAWVFATGSSTVSNFLGMKLVVFRKKISL